MGKKGNRGKGQQKKEKTVISLFEFNQNATVGQSTSVGPDREVAALPSAPKAAEDWEAEGGRPEYNSRGYKERRVDPYADTGVDDAEFESRDWTRRGPVDGADAPGFGTGPERDWQNSRQGPLDALDASADRDWGGMRRGPVDADVPATRDSDWSAARRVGPTESVFENRGVEQDWTARKGPVDALEPTAASSAENWAGARKGPVDAVEPTAASSAENWAGARKGPVDAVQPTAASAAENWADARKGPVDAVVVEKPERDWTARKGPVDAQPSTASPAPRDVNFSEMRRGSKVLPEAPAPPAHRDVNFSEMRRGSKVLPDPPAKTQDVSRPDVTGASSWRRSKPVDAPTRGPSGRPASGATTEGVTTDMARMHMQTSNGEKTAPPARDWGAARRGQPLPAMRRAPRTAPGSGFAAARKAAPPAAEVDGVPEIEITTDPTGEWTTVRTGERRRGPIRRGAPRSGVPVRREAEKLNAAPVVAAKVEDAASSIA